MDPATLGFLIVNALTGTPVAVEEAADELVRHEVVVLGELHDSDAGHRAQLELLRAMAAATDREVVISMEMFERDTQAVLDDYLRGRIDEPTFLEHARPWPNYSEHYRPVVEWARERGFPVLASNAPKSLARQVAFQGLDSLDNRRFLARHTEAPRNRYWTLFQESMKGHVGTDGTGALEQMYESQCLKDDTMAECITDYLSERPYRRPLVVHLCGRFHSDYGLGTVARILQRRPLARVGVVTMVKSDEPTLEAGLEERDRAHYVVVVERSKEARPLADRLLDAANDPEAAEAEEPKPDEPAPEEDEATPAASGPHGSRPALGFMPDYGHSGGVRIATVTPGGPAAQAGLRNGDEIVEIEGTRIASLHDYMDVMDGLSPGQKIGVTIRRGDERQQVKVELGRRP